jgi:hypothetical protein
VQHRRADAVRRARGDAEHLGESAIGRAAADRDDAHSEAVAHGDQLRSQRVSAGVDGEDVGGGERAEQFRRGAARDGVGGGIRRSIRCHDEKNLGIVVAETVHDDGGVQPVGRQHHAHAHEPAPPLGTIDRLDPSAIAARVAATSARSITISTATAVAPIIDRSRSTDATVAEPTRMRGVS